MGLFDGDIRISDSSRQRIVAQVDRVSGMTAKLLRRQCCLVDDTTQLATTIRASEMSLTQVTRVVERWRWVVGVDSRAYKEEGGGREEEEKAGFAGRFEFGG